MSIKTIRILMICAAFTALNLAPAHASDCWRIGQQFAAENNGTLTKADLTNRDGKALCELVVLVPGQDGERPKRLSKVVEAS